MIVYPRNTVTYLRNNQAVSWPGFEPATARHRSNVLTITPPSHREYTGTRKNHTNGEYSTLQNTVQNSALPRMRKKNADHIEYKNFLIPSGRSCSSSVKIILKYLIDNELYRWRLLARSGVCVCPQYKYSTCSISSRSIE